MAPRHRRQVSGPRRLTSWFTIAPQSVASLGTSTALLVAILSLPALAKRPFTIIRTYLEILLSSDQQIASESQQCAVGMAVVSDQAVAVGVTAVPIPSSDADSDLFYLHQWMFNEFVFASGVGIQQVGQRFTIDSKAVRKVNDDQDIIVVFEVLATSDGVSLSFGGRFLVKEH